MTSDRPGPSSRLVAALVGFALLLVGVVVGVVVGVTSAIAASALRPTAVAYTYDSAPHVAQSRGGVPAGAAAVSPRARSGWVTLTSQSRGRPYGSAVAAEGAGEASTSVGRTVADAREWLGPGGRAITNDAGDKIFLSENGLRRIRVDINRPYPHEFGHAHLEEFIDGKWVRSGPIYPYDVPGR